MTRMPGVLVVAALLLGACGSTTGLDDATTGAAGSDGLGVPVAEARGAGGAPGSQPADSSGPSATGAVAPSASAAPSASPSDTAAVPGAVSPPLAAAPTSGEPVKVGISYKKGLEQAGTATGFTISGGDTRAIFDAVIDEINRTGGLAGRPLEPVYGSFDAASSETGAQIDQRMCTLWTEDEHVEVVAAPGSMTEVLPACLQGKGVPFLFVTAQPSDAESFARFPLMHALFPGQYRTTGSWIDLLVRHGWFDGEDTKIGMIRYDEPAQERIAEDVLKPALDAHGLELTAEAAIDRTEQGVAAGKNALLAFKAQGVTHLLPLDPDGNMTLLGMKLAESNAYRPKWALTSYVLPYIQQTNNQAQLSGAGGFGWAPAIDVDDARDPGTTPARERCLDVMRDHGIQVVDRANVFAVSYSCDLLFLLQAVANRAGSFDPDAFRAAVAATTSFDSAAFAGIGFTPQRRDAANQARYFAWGDSCACFQYQSELFGF